MIFPIEIHLNPLLSTLFYYIYRLAKTKRMKKALVISGGGSKGAFAGGVAQYLMRNQGREYDIFVGTSMNHDSAYLQLENTQRRFFYRSWPFVCSEPEAVLQQIIGSSGKAEMEIMEFSEIDWDKVQSHVWFG